jgi:hypothetical protein
MVLIAILSTWICSENGLRSAINELEILSTNLKYILPDLLLSSLSVADGILKFPLTVLYQYHFTPSPPDYTSCYITPFITQRDIHIYKNRSVFIDIVMGFVALALL